MKRIYRVSLAHRSTDSWNEEAQNEDALFNKALSLNKDDLGDHNTRACIFVRARN